MWAFCRSAILVFLLTTPAIAADYWQWSPAGPHHAATVQVRCGNDLASGTYVTFDGISGILTVRHCGNSTTAVVTWSDGTTTQGSVTADYRGGPDLAFVKVKPHPTIKPVPVAEDAAVGERTEHVTYGGPQDTLRHFYGTLQSKRHDTSDWSVSCISGDSGGGVYNARGQLIGVHAYGYDGTISHVTINGSSWPIYRRSGGPGCRPVRSFLGRVKTFIFGGRRQACYPPQRQFYPPSQGQGQFYPPSSGCQTQPDLSPPITPPIPTPPQQTVTIDYDKLAELVYEKMVAQPGIFQGPPGQDGQPGQDGTNGRDGQPGAAGQDGSVASIDYERLATEVVGSLPPMQVEFQGGPSSATRIESIPVGGTLRIPPVKMEVQRPNGDREYQTSPLGKPIALKLFVE